MPEINLSRAIQQDFSVFEGNTFAFDLEFFEDDKVTPVDITTWDFNLDIKRKSEYANCNTGKTNFQSLTIGNGLTITSSNKLTISKILDLTFGLFKYDLDADAAGVVTTWAYGNLKIVDNV